MLEYLPDYDEAVRADIAELLNETPSGEWAELALCPGPYGCPCPTRNDNLPPGVEPTACEGCRVIHLYRPPRRSNSEGRCEADPIDLPVGRKI
jgi:hypothetical protein